MATVYYNCDIIIIMVITVKTKGSFSWLTVLTISCLSVMILAQTLKSDDGNHNPHECT